ncbi:hypothetical protein EI94DRAFT_1737405 [Lactarius quietus]|nr:hypothetical protein EI94DRAFT_1737405 [Lactarius quietus]
MLFQRSLISFVAATALASVVRFVTASAILGPRGTLCNPGTGILLCCNSSVPVINLSDTLQSTLKTLDPNVDTTLNVGVECTYPETTPAGLQWYCAIHRLRILIGLLTGRNTIVPNFSAALAFS